MLLTLDQYFHLHGRPAEPALISNAGALLAKVQQLLSLAKADGIEPGIDQVSKNPIASGYRPAGANAATANAAAASTHLTCEGVDLQDIIGTRALAVWCIKNLRHLEACGLWMEDPRWTAGRTNTDPWVHLQGKPPRSGKRVYVPSTAPAQDPDFYARHQLTVPA